MVIHIDRTKIDTAKAIFPQIYAYNLPEYPKMDGWVKIGYSEREDVSVRIREQVITAGIRERFEILWYEPAKFSNGQTFTDHKFHSYLKRHKQVKRLIDEHGKTEWFFYNGTPEKSLDDFNDFVAQNFNQASEQLDYQLRQEQQDAVTQTLAYFQDNEDGEFLWNAKPRFGKTLTTYDLARKLNAKAVLIVTNRPAIANSWFDDFEKFIAWQTDYAFVSTTDTLKERKTLNRDEFLDQIGKTDGKKAIIAFISLQDLKGSDSFGGKFDKLSWVKELNWDLLVIDEAHEGVDTLKTDVAFDNIRRKYTLHLSGTPFKALASGSFAEDEIYNWTYADEQKAKLEWNQEENNPYETLPCLNLFSYQMSQMISDKVNQGADIGGENIDFAFDLNEFFETDDKGSFVHKKEVEKWLNTLSQNEKYPFSTKELRNELKHTFWLLNRVDSAKALAKLLKNHPVFEQYEIVLAVGDGRGDDDDVVNGKALDRVKQAIKDNEKTITLSVGQLTTGVTVPEWTAVLMLSNVKSPALYMQTAFRAQNAWQYEQDGQVFQKKNAYVFDFAPERTLIIYDEFANNLSKNTVNGGGTTGNREDNIRELLNFFPVIAEDSDGKMVELDVNQVLTIPKMIKAQEVVKKGFLSNLLFQNVGRIFGANNDEVREILEQLNPVSEGKLTPNAQSNPIDTKNITLGDDGKPLINNEIVINTNNAKFGEKLYGEIAKSTDDIIANTKNLTNTDIATQIADTLKATTESKFKEIAKENGVSEKFAEKVVKEQSQAIEYEVQKIQKQNEIEQNTAKKHFENQLKTATSDSEKQQITEEFQAKKEQIAQNLQTQISETVNAKLSEFTEKSTETILQKSEQQKQETVEDDVRARLRGFSRTIPSFLMAYGNQNTTLASFDTHISDAVFKEVTGITLEQFRILRDKYEYFDEQVFDTAVQEFLQKRADLANYFENLDGDIFDYIPPQRTNQIFTPKVVVKMMLDKFEKENPDIFSNPNVTFADLYMKSGLYIAEIVKRLYVGLKDKIPDDNERLKHIFANQIYGFTPSEIIYEIAKNFVIGFDKNQVLNHSHIVHLDTTPYAKGELDFNTKLQEIFGINNMKFDVVVGNPPYQDENVGENKQATPVYHYFYDLSEKFSNKYCLISPARFLSNQGATPKSWNNKMLNDQNIRALYFNPKSAEVFSNTDIKGGVVIIYRDATQHFGAIDTFIAFEELRNIFRKVRLISKEDISHFVYSPDSYRFTDELFKENPNLIGRTDKSHEKAVSSSVFTRYPEIFFEEKPKDGEEYVQIFGRLGNERVYFWVKRKYISNHSNLDKWKIFVPGANGTGAIGEVLSTPVIGQPVIGHNQTFVSIGNFDTEFEAQALLKYIKSKFGRAMLGIMKTTQNNQSKNTWSKVPLQNFTTDSDIDWTQSISDIDKQLYAKYGLDDDEIRFIEEKVKEMA